MGLPKRGEQLILGSREDQSRMALALRWKEEQTSRKGARLTNAQSTFLIVAVLPGAP